MRKLTVGSLFAGIGGIDLGLERTGGFETVWQVEIDDYARRVLAKHWPNVRRWDDVRTFPPEPAEEWRCDVICGGFPCQDISDAGSKLGLSGKRSGLWREFARIIRVLRPLYVVVENVAALLDRGIGDVLGDLATIGYDAEWEVLSACAFGAPHTRERVFIIANSHRRVLRASRPRQDKAGPAGLPISRSGETSRARAGGQLNPAWTAWFMGFPESWTDLDHTATPSSPRLPNGSENES
jgi:DNA (cytosine-5)-methyltransferase 1